MNQKLLKNLLQRIGFIKENKIIVSYNKALEWIKINTIPEKGIIVSSKREVPYSEVTGYLIPTLIDAGEYNLAERYAEFLSYIQRPSGSFTGPDGREYIFDTGQALRGLLMASQRWNRFKPFALKAADYIASTIEKDGRIPSIYEEKITEYVHIFILPVLVRVSEVFNKPEYLKIAKNSLTYYKNAQDILDYNRLTHFLAYITDGFIDMDEEEFVRPFVKKIFSLQRKNGSIPALPNVNWTCSVGLAQFAIIGYKLGMFEEANKIIRYLCNIQNPSGGFFGSYGYGAEYFPDEEISWANKFFIDAIHLKIQSFFSRNTKIFPKKVTHDDGRLKATLNHLGNLENKKILDAGCGKGRFATKIKNLYPTCEVHGVDISSELLKEVPNSIVKKKGSILNLPYDSETFDGVFCIEALEHTIRTEKAIEELCRVLKENGRIIIIDKNIEKLGKMQITDFEQWFNKNEIKNFLRKYCHNVQVKEINHDKNKKEGLFLAWIGIKGSSILNSKEWHDLMIGNKSFHNLAKKLRSNQFPIWIKPLLEHSLPSDSLLEIGSGTGELSAILGIYGRIPHLLDYSDESIKYTKSLFHELGIEGHFYCANILYGVPLRTNSVDWVWSSGLLEHFSDDQIIDILKESTRVCKKGVMSLVPNAGSIFYRIGKFKMEKEGTWLYGKEIPKFTMKKYFNDAGLKNIKEYSVGIYHPLQFWDAEKKEIKRFYNSLNFKELQNLNQGYLIFTSGEK
jgi:malonyl-CoA O-methyltransferase